MFSFPNTLGASYCFGSCFGESLDLNGIGNFQCTGFEASLDDCSIGEVKELECGPSKTAGVVCRK